MLQDRYHGSVRRGVVDVVVVVASTRKVGDSFFLLVFRLLCVAVFAPPASSPFSDSSSGLSCFRRDTKDVKHHESCRKSFVDRLPLKYRLIINHEWPGGRCSSDVAGTAIGEHSASPAGTTSTSTGAQVRATNTIGSANYSACSRGFFMCSRPCSPSLLLQRSDAGA